MAMGALMEAPWISLQRFPGGAIVQCQACGAGGRMNGEDAVRKFISGHTQHNSPSPGHYGAGDLIAKAAQAVGIKGCAECEKRRVRANRALPRVLKR